MEAECPRQDRARLCHAAGVGPLSAPPPGAEGRPSSGSPRSMLPPAILFGFCLGSPLLLPAERGVNTRGGAAGAAREGAQTAAAAAAPAPPGPAEGEGRGLGPPEGREAVSRQRRVLRISCAVAEAGAGPGSLQAPPAAASRLPLSVAPCGPGSAVIGATAGYK